MTVKDVYMYNEKIDADATISVYVNERRYDKQDIPFISLNYNDMPTDILRKNVKAFKIVNRFVVLVLVSPI